MSHLARAVNHDTSIHVTTTVGAFVAAARVLDEGLDRGYWSDDDFCDLASRAADKFRGDTDTFTSETLRTVEMSFGDFDDVLGILVCDTEADTRLRPLIDQIDAALN